MGTRDQYETVTGVIKAFADNRLWRQADLARHLGIEARRLRAVLLSLQEQGMPLEKEEEHPHVIWTVPRNWFPGGVFFDLDDWDVLVQAVLLQIADEPRRQKMLARLLNGQIMGSVDLGIERLERGILGQPVTPQVQQASLLVQQAVLEHRPLRISYFSASSGKITDRVVSPQRLLNEPHPRLAAYCHAHRQLRNLRYFDGVAQRRSLPHRQLRNDDAWSGVEVFSSLPHRQLRNHR